MTASPPDPGIGARIQRLDHVAISVDDIRAARALFVDLLGGRFINGGDNHPTGVRIIHLGVGGATVELMQPLRADCQLAEHIRKRGTGFHHLTFVVDDLPQTITELDVLGVRTVGTQLEPRHWRETFLSPRNTFGALVQLVDTDLDWHTPTSDYDFDDVLAGRVEWLEAIACVR